ncbi:hypothetical protein BFQ30_02710 [Haemophilus quentini]|uniref:Lipoprotein n=1 Tax=Haemophilus quentini TaxID=123834 RepID=A0ABX3BM19_9PAST|nr:DUF799 domain-containing protein [Haemophilus quentini]EGT82224.1 lipoprotein [Haemophilus haemolyticus M21639]OEY75035.1 hypothetical protein BFQ30_02710 [Haemophilus quentini]OEY76246.1 hypothetical protein BFQ29_01350 [Haemophilus quentini]ORC36115.1 hypothetical protein BES36_006500 [Haemophilus quentini]
MKKISLYLVIACTLLLSACSTMKPTPYDYTNYQESKPRSILVLLPTDTTNDVKGSPAVLAHTISPLAEEGYYVFPPALVYETFKHNGLTQAQEIHNVNLQKLRDIFGADAVLYINVDDYGVNYQVFDSVTRVRVSGKLVDLHSGKTLWEGTGYADDADRNNNGNAIAMLITAVVKQIANNVSDKGYKVAAWATGNMLNGPCNGCLLYGPRHPLYGQDPQLQPQQK